MWFRKSMYDAPWVPNGLQQIEDALSEVMDWNDLRRQIQLFRGFWHNTRVLEYPWALKVAPPTGNVFDVGSNPQFGMALLELNPQTNVTLHFTHQDVTRLGFVPMGNHGQAYINLVRNDYRRRFAMVLHDLHPGDPYFDTIYCLSVLEHYPPEEIEITIKAIWSLLNPGGKAVFTIDYFLDHPMGEGQMPYGINHDIFRHIAQLPGLKYTAHINPEEIPGHAMYDASRVKDLRHELHLGDWHPIGAVAVYGFVIQKAA